MKSFITAGGSSNSYIYDFDTDSWTNKAAHNQDGMTYRIYCESGFIRLADGSRTVVVLGGISNLQGTYMSKNRSIQC